MRLEGSEKMNVNFQVQENAPQKSDIVAKTLAGDGGTAEFFVGWLRRLEPQMKLFAFPLNKKEHPRL